MCKTKLVKRDLKDLERTSALPTTNVASQQLDSAWHLVETRSIFLDGVTEVAEMGHSRRAGWGEEIKSLVWGLMSLRGRWVMSR